MWFWLPVPRSGSQRVSKLSSRTRQNLHGPIRPRLRCHTIPWTLLHTQIQGEGTEIPSFDRRKDKEFVAIKIVIITLSKVHTVLGCSTASFVYFCPFH